MRTKVEQDFLDNLEKYILEMGKTINFSEQSPITSEFFSKYLISNFVHKLSRHEFLEIWLDDIYVFDKSLNLYDGVNNVREFIQKDLVNKYSFFALYVMNRPN